MNTKKTDKPNPKLEKWSKIVHFRESKEMPPICNTHQLGKWSSKIDEVTCRSCKKRRGRCAK